jgi:3' terminal RNA ribose 2'-O-methyltransferase Hen1
VLLTISTTHSPARDLGYLLGKHPDRTQTFTLAHGTAHVCFPEATNERCTVALILDIDPVGLVRRPEGDEAFALLQYTNDRPYVASSFTSVAIGRVFHQALAGRSVERPELAQTRIPLEVQLTSVPVRGGERFLRALFEPLGYAVEAQRIELDEALPDWGPSPYHDVTLRASVRLDELLRHLTVLLPVLDDDKHYWVGTDEIDKLLDRGEGWLATHPEREQIAQRYLKHRNFLSREAMRRLTEDEPEPEQREQVAASEEDALEQKLQHKETLADVRLQAVVEHVRACGARSVLDLGCGEGKLLRKLLQEREIDRIVGVDVSIRCLERAHERLRVDEMPPRQRKRLTLIQGSLIYRDERFSGFDAACLVEVIEHVELSRLAALERVLFEFAQPSHVIVTTPNAEYNVRFESLPAGKMRHRDHRFEWTRAEFQAWAEAVAERQGYTVELGAIGPVDDTVGAPTQIGVFTR